MTILEAYAAGVPVIATALGGMPELVRDGVDGLIVRHDDPAALAAAVHTLLDDPASARERGRSGQARLRGDFDPQTHLHRLDEVYAEASARRRDRRAPGGLR